MYEIVNQALSRSQRDLAVDYWNLDRTAACSVTCIWSARTVVWTDDVSRDFHQTFRNPVHTGHAAE